MWQFCACCMLTAAVGYRQLEAFKLRDPLHVGLLCDSIDSGNCEVIAESTEKRDCRFIVIMITNSP